jgi:hypothetical protein
MYSLCARFNTPAPNLHGPLTRGFQQSTGDDDVEMNAVNDRRFNRIIQFIARLRLYDYLSHFLDLYESYVEMADNISARWQYACVLPHPIPVSETEKNSALP